MANEPFLQNFVGCGFWGLVATSCDKDAITLSERVFSEVIRQVVKVACTWPYHISGQNCGSFTETVASVAADARVGAAGVSTAVESGSTYVG